MSTMLPHTAHSIYFSCIDDRLTTARSRFLAHHEPFHSALAGGARAFLDPQTRATALHQIMAAYNLSGISDVYLESHTDCGAYRLAGVTFDTPQAELNRLRDDLEAASAIIRQALTEAGAESETITLHGRILTPDGSLQAEISFSQSQN